MLLLNAVLGMKYQPIAKNVWSCSKENNNFSMTNDVKFSKWYCSSHKKVCCENVKLAVIQ